MLSDKQKKVVRFTIIMGVIVLILLIVWVLFTNAKYALSYIGIDNHLWFLPLVVLSLESIILFYIFAFKGFSTNRLFSRFNIWILIWICLLLVLVAFCIPILTIYPGQSELGRDYSLWKINNGYGSDALPFIENISGVRLYSVEKGNKFFTENDQIEFKFSFKEDLFYISSFEFKDEFEHFSSAECSNSSCEGKFRLNSSVRKIEIIPTFIQKDNYSNVKQPMIMSIYLEPKTETEVKKIQKEEFLFLGSLLSIILLTSAAFVNQIREIWRNK